jgi:hyperosmotically inducible periplasmic protein
MQIQTKSGQLLLALCLSATVAITGLTGCATSDRTAGRVMDDRRTEHEVRHALAKDPLYKFPDVRTQTFDGVVELSGFVDTPEQKEMAESIAQRVEGAHSVINALTLKPRIAGSVSPTGYSTGQRMDSDTAPVRNTAPPPATTPGNNPPPQNPNPNQQQP